MDVNIAAQWVDVASLVVLLGIVIYGLIRFIRMPSDEQVRTIKECLLNWVVQAEAQLGSGTGKVKLSEVYGQFVKAFPFLKTFVRQETFSEWVDEALDKMREMLESNGNLRDVVGIEKGDKV